MRFTSTVAGCLVFAGALFAQSTSSGVMQPSGPTTSISNLKQYLTLTDGQVTSLVNIQQQQAQAQQQVSDQIQQKYATLQTLLQATNPNPNTVGQTMIDIQNLQKQLTPSIEPYRTQALAILTQAQVALLSNLNTALQLQNAAYEAVSVNLLTAPAPQTCASLVGCPIGVIATVARSGVVTVSPKQ